MIVDKVQGTLSTITIALIEPIFGYIALHTKDWLNALLYGSPVHLPVLDAIIFTAGIGENSSIMRTLACENLDFLGIHLDDEKNSIRSKEIREIQSSTSKVKVFIIPTNEEIEIAKQSYQLLN